MIQNNMPTAKKNKKYVSTGFRIEEDRMLILKKLARTKSAEENKDITITSLMSDALYASYGI